MTRLLPRPLTAEIATPQPPPEDHYMGLHTYTHTHMYAARLRHAGEEDLGVVRSTYLRAWATEDLLT